MRGPYPQRVRLRNGNLATVNGMVLVGQAEVTYLQGSHPHAGYELWHGTGRWSDRGHDHPLDIVACASAQGQDCELNTTGGTP